MSNQDDYQRGFDDGVQVGIRKDTYRWYSEEKARHYQEMQELLLKCEEERDRYKKALEHYADRGNWANADEGFPWDDWYEPDQDGWVVAEQALKDDR